MIEKKTIIDQIEITRSGSIQIRFGLILEEDGKEIDCKWHRTSVEPGGDLDAQLAAVDNHLQLMGKSPIEQGEALNTLRAVKSLVDTPERIKSFEDSIKVVNESESK